jgi:predicted DNA-binding transcriptional regulator AlpA
VADRRQVEAPAPASTLTAADLAALLRTTPKQIANMRARGQVPAPAKVPGLGLRWSRLTIEAWLAEQLAE